MLASVIIILKCHVITIASAKLMFIKEKDFARLCSLQKLKTTMYIFFTQKKATNCAEYTWISRIFKKIVHAIKIDSEKRFLKIFLEQFFVNIVAVNLQ